MRLLAFALLVTVGCFDPGPPSLRCSVAMPGCPDGLVCIADLCQQSDAVDAQVSNDFSHIDMMQVNGCAAGNGQPIGTNNCWLCPGQFGNGANPKAPAMCSPTHTAPSNANLILEPDCLAVKAGFFVANVYGATKYSDPTVSECGKFTTAGLAPAFFGCGVGGGIVNTNVACSGFRQNIQCQTVNGIKCTDETFINMSNTVPTNGVICCPK